MLWLRRRHPLYRGRFTRCLLSRANKTGPCLTREETSRDFWRGRTNRPRLARSIEVISPSNTTQCLLLSGGSSFSGSRNLPAAPFPTVIWVSWILVAYQSKERLYPPRVARRVTHARTYARTLSLPFYHSPFFPVYLFLTRESAMSV